MAHSPKYLDPQTLAKLEGLQLRVRHIVEGYLAGLHRSPYRGFSIEFSEHREYAPGDDPRYLDWKVFGRTDKYYIKQYEDETNLIAYLVVDSSESMTYRGPESALSKFDYGAMIAASLAWLVLKQQDAAALVTFDAGVDQFVRPASGGQHIAEIMQALDEAAFRDRTSIGAVLTELSERFRHKGVVILVSDLLDDIDSLADGLRQLRSRRHEVMLVHVLDRAEIELPYDLPTRFLGMELAPTLVADPVALRSAYQQELTRYLAKVESLCRAEGVKYCHVPTDTAIDHALARVLAR